WAWDEIRVGCLDRVLRAGWHLGRFDSRGWIGDVEVPHAVVVCEADEIVPTDRQRQLAEALPAATVVEVAGDHGACVNRADLFVPALERALDAVTAPVGR
ncbi:MAG: alpha/beta hydrolase, partial [Actinomycetota bacterium]|nr:alpha/beta hydrolase [Actinomycetota bacterium]